MEAMREIDCASNCLDWDNYVKINNDLENMSEKDAIEEIEKYAQIIDNDKKLSDKLTDDFAQLCLTMPDNRAQAIMIKQLGDQGGSELVNVLCRKWGIEKMPALNIESAELVNGQF